eukprot:2000904-Amphidinium_carterae.1
MLSCHRCRTCGHLKRSSTPGCKEESRGSATRTCGGGFGMSTTKAEHVHSLVCSIVHMKPLAANAQTSPPHDVNHSSKSQREPSTDMIGGRSEVDLACRLAHRFNPLYASANSFAQANFGDDDIDSRCASMNTTTSSTGQSGLTAYPLRWVVRNNRQGKDARASLPLF